MWSHVNDKKATDQNSNSLQFKVYSLQFNKCLRILMNKYMILGYHFFLFVKHLTVAELGQTYTNNSRRLR